MLSQGFRPDQRHYIGELSALIERLKKEYDLPDIRGETDSFFVELHGVFVSYFEEENCDGLSTLITIVYDSFKVVGPEKSACFRPILSDLILCLRFEELSAKVYTLFDDLCKNLEFWKEFRLELETTSLIANDKPLIDALKLMADSCQPGSKHSTDDKVISKVGGDETNVPPHKSGVVGGTQSLEELNVANADGDGNGEDISLLPQSVMEQWLLARSLDEVS